MVAAMSLIRSKRATSAASPSMWRLVMSQLLMPEERDSPL